MKRLYTLIVLVGLAMATMLTGCSQGDQTSAPATPSTNAPASTNK